MVPTTTPLRIYEELADYYERQAQAQLRDRFLLLAADAALTAGHVEEAERLRQRLLEHSPHHMLRPFASFTEAMRSPDVQGYLDDLRQSYPQDTAEQLLGTLRGTPLPPRETNRPAPPSAPPPEPPPTFHTETASPFRVFSEEEESVAPPPPKPAAPKPPMKPAPARPPAPAPMQKVAPPAPEPPRPAPPSRPPAAAAPPPPPAPRPASPPAQRPQPLRNPAPARERTPPPTVERPPPMARYELAPVEPPAPLPTAPLPTPQVSIPLQRSAGSPRSEPAQPRPKPPVNEEAPGAWFSSFLFGVVFLAGLAYLAYTLGKPFLPPHWLP